MKKEPSKKQPDEEQRRQKQPRLPLQWDSNDAAEMRQRSGAREETERDAATEAATGAGKPGVSEKSLSDDAAGTDDKPEVQPIDAAETVRADLIQKSSPKREAPEKTEDEIEFLSSRADSAKTQEAPRRSGDVQRVRLPSTEISLGQSLLEGRGTSNLSIAQVAQQTKIPASFIDAVESDALDELPPPVYTRSYISQLCRLYGMDAGPLLDEYERVTAPSAPAPHATRQHRFTLSRENDGGTVKYGPRDVREADASRLVDRISRIAVAGAVILIVVLVAAAVIIHQIKNYRIRRSEARSEEYVSPSPVDASATLEELIIPQQLPLKDLEIPDAPGEDAPR